jgi:hypothetical protein
MTDAHGLPLQQNTDHLVLDSNGEHLPFLHCAALVRTVGPLRDQGAEWRWCRLPPQYLFAEVWPVCGRHKKRARIDHTNSPIWNQRGRPIE